MSTRLAVTPKRRSLIACDFGSGPLLSDYIRSNWAGRLEMIVKAFGGAMVMTDSPSKNGGSEVTRYCTDFRRCSVEVIFTLQKVD
jgi:hypothetical protein